MGVLRLMSTTCFNAHILTLFPDMFPGPLAHSVVGRALDKGIWSLSTTNIRDFATDNHKTVDDTPYGGGAGMVMRADIVGHAIESLPQEAKKTIYYLSPRGKTLDQAKANEIAKAGNVTLLCGHYEGVDARVLDYYNVEELSIGDYVLSGGEIAAHVVLDSVVRLLPGVLGSEESLVNESFENSLLEHSHYTRPLVWNGLSVPEVLLSGHHANIDAYRLEESQKLTEARRPDLWQKAQKIK